MIVAPARNPVVVGENIQDNTYGPVGKCIYCGSSGGDDGLRTEHVIPLSLGGKTELLEASCTRCEGITSALDGYLARNIYYDIRLSMPVFPSRRPKERPKVRGAHFIFEDREETVEFPTGTHPFFTVLPIWDIPGALRGVQPSIEFPPCRGLVYTYAPPNLPDQLGMQEGERATMRAVNPFNLSTFGRALAKIAYCHAVISYGFRQFRPLVMPQLILGKYACISHFVGSQPTDPPPPDRRDLMHSIGFRDAVNGRQKLILAVMRLFANSGTDTRGMPIYLVVVGTPR